MVLIDPTRERDDILQSMLTSDTSPVVERRSACWSRTVPTTPIVVTTACIILWRGFCYQDLDEMIAGEEHYRDQ